ncbi:hypothetical protein APHAL10511_002965 [Amanita phalloides]|nr:hypothetical protein APHAL10511_002965 [Amanita phalloides]
MEVQLDPPIGTCYFKTYTSSVASDGGGFYKFHLDVTFYIYVTLAKPSSNFTADGGKVYIVAVYSGWCTDRGVNSSLRFGFADKSSLRLRRTTQLPITGSGTQNGETYTYTIDFGQTMSMFNNSGNSQYNFPARYKRTHSVTGFTQAELQPSTTWGWRLNNIYEAKEHDQRPNLHGLHVFETNQLGIAKCEIFCDVYWNDEALFQAHKEENLDFRAETMKGNC